MNKKQIEELDSKFRKIIRERDTYPVCPLCFNSFSPFRERQVCHDVKRRYLATRWKVDNAVIACSICNTEDVDISLIIDKRFGDGTSESNRIFAKRNPKTDYHEVQEYLCQQASL